MDLFEWKNDPVMGIKLSWFQRLVARIIGVCYIGKHQPKGFIAPTKFWLAHDRRTNKFYVYYEHGFHRHSNFITNFMPPPWELEKKIYWSK
jgi:hypothetical protein